MKDKEWLKDEVARIYDTRDYWSVEDLRDEILDSINELDEPEVPVVPEDVYEHIKMNKVGGVPLDIALDDAIGKLEILGSDGVQFHEFRNNQDNYAKAWLAYPNIEVEEKPLYRARLKVITDKFIASYLRTQSSDVKDRLKALEIGSKYIHEGYRHLSEFTENELKRLGIWNSEQWEVEEVE